MIASDADILSQIQQIVLSLDAIPADVSRTIDARTNIVRDLRLDSLAVMDFIMALETRFDTIVPLDRLAEIHTIGDLVAVLGASAPART